MNIKKIDVYLTRIPFLKSCRFADLPIEEMDTVFVRFEDSDGHSGWSEVFPGNKPYLTAAYSSGVFLALKECVIPQLGTEISIDSTENLTEQFSKIKGNRHAKAACDLAFWDIYSKKIGKPLYEVIGGQKKDIELGLVFDRYNELGPFLDDLAKAVDEGYKRVTLKTRPGWDLQILGIVRADHPLLMIQCDLEGALSMDKHAEILYRFDDFMISLLEQPLAPSEYVGHAMLQDGMRTSIALDESITQFHQAQIALDLKSADTFCLKPGKVGGLTEAKLIHDACSASEVVCYAGCDYLTSIGYRSVLALSTLKNFTIPTDYIRFDEILSTDPGEQLSPVLKPDENGKERKVIELWTEPGIGFEPDREMIEKMSIAKFSWPD